MSSMEHNIIGLLSNKMHTNYYKQLKQNYIKEVKTFACQIEWWIRLELNFI